MLNAGWLALLVALSFLTSDSFDIIRPTIELLPDEILMETGDCSEVWPIPVYPSVSTTDSQSQ
jgi:hypothetical protein